MTRYEKILRIINFIRRTEGRVLKPSYFTEFTNAELEEDFRHYVGMGA